MMQLGYEPQDLRHRNEIFLEDLFCHLGLPGSGSASKRRMSSLSTKCKVALILDLERLIDEFLANLACDIGLNLPFRE